MILKRWLLLCLVWLTACAPAAVAPAATVTVAAAEPSPTPTEKPTAAVTPAGRKPEWWETAVFYEIFVRSFYDSDGDGVGDFDGITAKLDYLNDGDPASQTDLGVTALWLMPIFPSPSYHGYDVTDYYTVNPQYGTLEDFKLLLSEAERRGIRVIIDLVINHTSSQHPWFLQAGDLQSPYRDWYVWSAEDPVDAGWPTGPGGYYYANFSESMPDLNFNNPAVTAEIDKITTFWLRDVGVDGFRIDAAKHLFEDGKKIENVPATYTWFKEYYQAYKAVNPQAFCVGEVYGAGATLVKSYSGDKLDMVFNFEIASGIVNSVKGEGVSGVNSAIKFTLMDMPGWSFATFLTNHDQDRLMDVVSGSPEKAKAAASILLTLPGTPFIYYGEEIGMRGVKPDEDIRRPMQWNGEAGAGFTTGLPWRAADQTNLQANVAVQAADSDSLLRHYTRLIALRQEYLSPVDPRVELVSSGDAGVYAILRVQASGSVLVLVNLSGQEKNGYSLSLRETSLADGTYTLRSIWDNETPSAPLVVAGGAFQEYRPAAVLAPYSTHIYQVQSSQ